jgi:putative peptidoglycan lipid II flippase
MRTPITLGILAILQLLVALIGQLAVLRIVGIGSVTDAYIAAQAVPLILTAVVAASLQSLWLPRFSREGHDPSALRDEQCIAQGQSLLILALMSALLWLGSAYWAALAFPGFGPEQRDLVVFLGAPLFAAAVFNSQSGLLTAGFRASGSFYVAEAVSLSTAVIALAMILLLVPKFGILAAACISALRAAAVYGVLYLKAGRPAPRLRRTETSRLVARQVRPLIIGGIFIKAGPLVDRYWSSQAVSGSVTLLSVAQLAMNSLATILERALLVQVLPSFSKLLKQGDVRGLRASYNLCLLKILMAVVVVGVFLLLLRPVWTVGLTEVLSLPPETAHEVWLLCVILLPSLYVSVAGSAAVAVFYAFGETSIPTAIGVCGFLASLVLKGVLFAYFGILGVAAGASLYLALNMVLYHFSVLRRIGLAQRA